MRVVHVRIALVLVAALLLIGAVQLRRGVDEPAELRTLTGVTGQRQAIEFRVGEDGRPSSFQAVLYGQCPGAREQRLRWTPGDGAPVPFHRNGGRLIVRERSSLDYEGGRSGRVVGTLRARETEAGLEGSMRSVWRFEEHGEEYLVCDSGHVPFAVGEGARDRLPRVAPATEPWTLYPPRSSPRRPTSERWERFAQAVDHTCAWTWNAVDRVLRREARWLRRHPRGTYLVRRLYVRGHAAQLRQLARLGFPPGARAPYLRWLDNFEERVGLERRQLTALRRGDLDAYASLAAEIATLKANGNAAGLNFGLRTCTSNGPTGAPKG